MRARVTCVLLVSVLLAAMMPAAAVAAPAAGPAGSGASVAAALEPLGHAVAAAVRPLGRVLANAGQSLPERLRDLLGLGGAAEQRAEGPAVLPRRDQVPPGKPLKSKRVKELTGKRTAQAKFFELEDGRVEAELSLAPVHYRDAKGGWQAIDTRIGAVDRPGFAYGSLKNGFGSLFGARSDRLLRVEQGARHVTVGLPGAARALTPQVRGSTLTYPGALGDGVDLVYQVGRDGVKEQIVLARPPAEAAWTFTLQLGGLRARALPDGSIGLFAVGGGDEPVYVLPKPFMVDATDDPASPYGKRWSDNVTQTVAQQGADLEVTVRADAAWLAAPERRYPVVVDPTIKLQPTDPLRAQDTMILSSAPTTSYEDAWRLQVGTTAAGKARSLVQFDLSGIPAGTQIDSAQLMTYFDQVHTAGGNSMTVEARRVTADWSEYMSWNEINAAFAERGGNVELVDNGDVGKVAVSGTWPASTSPSFTAVAVNQNYQYNKGGPTGETFTYLPRLTEAGDYQVEAHSVTFTDRTTAAPYTVHHNGAGAPTTVNVDQTSSTVGGRWTTLGTWPFAAGTTHKVVLGDVTDATKVVSADAVRFTKPGIAVKPALQADTWHAFSVRNIVQAWLDGAQPNYGFMLKAVDSDEVLGKGGPVYQGVESFFDPSNDYGGETINLPKLLVTYGRPGVTLNPPTKIHATGAELSWSPYVDPSPSPDDDLVEYQVFRRRVGSFKPEFCFVYLSYNSCKLASVAPGATTFVDTTATPTPPDDPDPEGEPYVYWVEVKTKDGQTTSSPTERVTLPKVGRTKLIVQGSALDTTLSSTQRTTGHDVMEGRAWLTVGNNSATYGTTRTLVQFDTTAIPTGATMVGADLGLWSFDTIGSGATYDLHKLTRAFSETAASWDKPTAGLSSTWTTPGGDYAATVLGRASGMTSDPKWRTWRGPDVTSTVQGWVGDPSTNFGFLVKLANETTPAEQTRFVSSEGAEPLLRPRLVVTYTEKTPENTYYAPTTPERMSAGDSITVPVTVTNTTPSVLRAADYQLTYKWLRPDGVTNFADETNTTNQVQTPLPRDLAPGESVTVNATMKAPTPPAGDPANQRIGYVPTWELRNPATGKYFSEVTGGVGGLRQKMGVERPTSNELGLEKFYAYVGTNTGAGTAALVNQHSGNLVWSYDPLANPSRGPATFVRLTYNSQDTSASSIGFGWSLSAASLMRQGTPLQFHPPGQDWPTTVRLTDGDGTTHTFTLNKHGSPDPAVWDYDHPFGVHLYLRKTGSTDPARAWVLTRPDRTQFYFDTDGYQSATRDKNANELLFTYERRKSNNKPIKFLRTLTDATGRKTLTVTTYAKGQGYDYYDSNTNQRLSASNLTNPHIIDQVATITAISGPGVPARQLKLVYSDKGLLKELVDGEGHPTLAKTFLFDYDATQGNRNVKLVKVTDPRAAASSASPKPATTLAYYSPPDDEPRFHWWAKTITDRLGPGHTTSFAYVDPDGPQGSVMHTTVTDAESHATFYRTDRFGRPDLVRNAKQQETALDWDGDHNVTELREANGQANQAVSKWTYDPNTGYPLTITDAQAVADNTAPTKLTYQPVAGFNGFVVDLVEKLSPQGRKWKFEYDAFGNLTKVTDPKGTATPADPNDFDTNYEYDDPFGQLTKATDANQHATLFSDYDPTGYPKTITDARGKDTDFIYDVRGNVLTVTDPREKTTSQAYDLFGRPGENRAPKNQDAGQFIVTPAPVYDRNDNITQVTAPNGAVTSAVYDDADQLRSMELPKDESADPARVLAYTYDKVGNLRTQTEPKGTLTTTDTTDFVTTYSYDEIYQLTSVVNAKGDRLTYAYDTVGNVETVVDPRKNATADPADFTAKYTYDKSHRRLATTDAAGHQTATDYDLDGLVVSTTDQENNTTLVDLDERGMPRQVRVPHDNPGGTITYRTTGYEYDQVGNRTRVITPRGTETPTDPVDFAIGTTYDELNRIKEQLLPYDPDDSQITTADKVIYAYDSAGRLISVSAPPSAGQTVRNITSYTHFDNGWVRTATDPHAIATTYDYNPLGQQTSRTLTSAGGSSSRSMGWTYFPDGKLASRTDEGVSAGRQVVLVDNSDTPNVAMAGTTWPTATSGAGLFGFDYRTHAAGTGTGTFTWKLHVPQSGTYEVFAQYPAGATATNAAYRVEHAAGATTRAVNQTQGVGTWVSLGSFSFTEGDGGAGRQVVLSDAANGTVVADAVKLVRDTSADPPDSERKTLTYKYDPNGNLVTTTDTSSGARVDTYKIAYDGLNRVERVEERTGGVTGTLRNSTSFTYDPNGNPDTRTHDKEFTRYRYDPRDLVDRATIGKSATDPDPKVTSFTYTPRGQKLLETKANNNTVDHTYYLDGLLKTQVERKANGTGALVSSHTIAYDPNGHRRSDIARTQNADNHAAYLDHTYAYSYDPRDRIRSVTKSATGGGVLETEAYTHDANNNVIAQTVDNATTNFEYDRNRLLRATTGTTVATYNYDPFGRLDKVTSGTTVLERYVYDGFDRVKEHRKTTGTSSTETTRYAYDPLDRTASRTEKAGTANQKTTDFNYLGLSGEVLSEEVSGQIQKSYQYSPWGQRLSQVKFTPGGGEEDSFYGYNPHSDVETLTSESGDTRATYGYTAYGKDDTQAFTGIDKPQAQTPGAEPYNVYRFNAKRVDPATGDYDMGFRDYDPGLNRFLTRDLYNGALADLNLGLSPWTMNRYGFAGGNPISLIELDGHVILGPDGGPSRPRTTSPVQCPREYCGDGGSPGSGSSGGGVQCPRCDAHGGELPQFNPEEHFLRSVICANDDLGQAIAGGADTLSGTGSKVNQLGYPHAVCGMHTQQNGLMPLQSANGPLVLQGPIPGLAFSGGDGGGAGPSPLEEEAAWLEATAIGIWNILPAGRNKNQSAVAVVAAMKSDGTVVEVVAGSGQGLTAAQKNALDPKARIPQIAADNILNSDAETTALAHIQKKGWKPLAGGSSRPVCPWCENAIRDSRGRLVGPTSPGRIENRWWFNGQSRFIWEY